VNEGWGAKEASIYCSFIITEECNNNVGEDGPGVWGASPLLPSHAARAPRPAPPSAHGPRVEGCSLALPQKGDESISTGVLDIPSWPKVKLLACAASMHRKIASAVFLQVENVYFRNKSFQSAFISKLLIKS